MPATKPALHMHHKNGYSQLEKELLFIVFGCRCLDDYIYSKTILVKTDLKLLVSIFQKKIHPLTPQVQKMILHFQRYILKVTYKPGKDLLMVDTLSRVYLKEYGNPLYDELLNVKVISSLPMIPERLKLFQACQSTCLLTLHCIKWLAKHKIVLCETILG